MDASVSAASHDQEAAVLRRSDELDAGPTLERDRADSDVGRNLERELRGIGETLRGELLSVCRHDRCRQTGHRADRGGRAVPDGDDAKP